MTAQPCGALLPPLADAGWECNGVGLIIVMTIRGGSLPIVLPRRALEIIDPEPWWDSPIVDFTGGDHAHLCVPRRPTTSTGDSTLVFGSSAMRFKSPKWRPRRYGTATDGDAVFFGPLMEKESGT